MLKSHGRQFDYEYRSDSRASNLVINLSRDDVPIYHQMDMLISNNISGVLKMNPLVTDERISLYYDITSKISLAKFLELKRLERLELLNILLNITTTLRFCDGYLLYDRCFVFDEEFIFIDPSTLSTCLVYIPTDTNIDFNEVFKEFVLNVVTRLARLEEKPQDGNYVQRIIENLKQDAFSIRTFRELISGMIDQTITTKDDSDSPAGRYECRHAPSPSGGGSKTDKKTGTIRKSRTVFFKWLKGIKGLKDTKSHTGSKNIAKEALPMAEDGYRRYAYEDLAGTTVQTDIGRVGRMHETSYAYMTEVLNKTKYGVPVLRETGVVPGEEIPIVKNGMVIGRLGGIVDHVSKNMAIGKVHAEVVFRDGEYFIRDLNSRNGTYINGEKVNSNTDYRIKNGDRITLANCDYEFVVP